MPAGPGVLLRNGGLGFMEGCLGRASGGAWGLGWRGRGVVMCGRVRVCVWACACMCVGMCLGGMCWRVDMCGACGVGGGCGGE